MLISLTTKTLQECKTALILQYQTLFLVFCLFVFLSSYLFVFMSFFLSFSVLFFVFLYGHIVSKLTLCLNSKVAVSESVTTKGRYRATRAGEKQALDSDHIF